METVVFGGTGFIGKNLMLEKPDWIYIGRTSSKENGKIYDYGVDLLDEESVDSFFNNFSFTEFNVINLASIVGGIFFNECNQHSIMYDNINICKNVFQSSKKYGVKKIVSSLSTCAWPDKCETYPFVESDLMKGPPPFTNGGYAHAKRIMQFESLLARSEGFNSVTFAPCNVYGIHDKFDEFNSHLVASIFAKVKKLRNGDTLFVRGDGTPRRQQLYAEDLAKVIVNIHDEYVAEYPIIVAPDEEFTVREIVEEIVSAFGKEIEISFTGNERGQLVKTGSNSLLKTSGLDVKFTPLKDGLKKMIDHYGK